MASITMHPVSNLLSTASSVAGGEKIIVINSEGKPATITVNQILDKMDDSIVDRIDDEILEKVEDQIDDMIDERLENIDTSGNLKWNEVL